MDGAGSVFHLASFISVSENHSDLVEKVNIQGTRNVVDACLAAGVKRLVHASSVQAYWQPDAAAATHEGMKLSLNGRSLLYDRTKAEGQRIVLEAVSRGLEAVVINPTGMIGPNDYNLSRMGEAILSIASGTYPLLVDGGFDWVDARDVVQGALAAEARGKSGECYLLSGHWVHLRDVSAAISRLTGKRTARLAVPLWLAGAGAWVNELIALLARRRTNFTPGVVRTLRMSRRISHEKASRDLGYEPRPFEETMRDTLDWFRQNGYLEG